MQIKSYYGVSRNLLVKFKDDSIDETPTLAQVLSSEAAISSVLDMSIRTVPGDHGLPLQQVTTSPSITFSSVSLPSILAMVELTYMCYENMHP